MIGSIPKHEFKSVEIWFLILSRGIVTLVQISNRVGIENNVQILDGKIPAELCGIEIKGENKF